MSSINSLTAKELEVLRLVAARLPNKAIARRLCRSLYTVKNHVHNIIDKLHVTSRQEAVRVAMGIDISKASTRCDECPIAAKATVIAADMRRLASELHERDT